MVDKEQVVKQAEHDRQVRLEEAEMWDYWLHSTDMNIRVLNAAAKRLVELRAGKEPQL